MRGEEIRIEVYEAMLAELWRHPAGTTIADIQDRIFADGDVQTIPEAAGTPAGYL